MRICILTVGSRGDVQPYVALGAGLSAAGHAVRMAIPPEFAPLCDGRGMECFPIGGDVRAVLDGDLAHAMLASGENPWHFLRRFARLTAPLLRQLTADGLRAAEGAELLILGSIAIFTGYDLTARQGIPVVPAMLQPMSPTRVFASPFFPPLPPWLPARLYNAFSHHAFGGLIWGCFGPGLNAARRALGLPPLTARRLATQMRDHRGLMLYGYSPSAVPRPADWPPHLHVTGYWFLDHQDWQPPSTLADFLAAGPPPVYIGFGSMIARDPEATTQLAVEALQRTGRRGILLTGWGSMQRGELPDDVLVIDSAPHDWLLPRMAAVVHHGGAGTTAAGLRSGVPSIVVPHFADQPFWARTAHALGVGPEPIPRGQLTAERLAEAISYAVTDTGMRARAAELGARICAEDGVGEAVRLIEAAFDH